MRTTSTSPEGSPRRVATSQPGVVAPGRAGPWASIHPRGLPAPYFRDGNVDLYTQAGPTGAPAGLPSAPRQLFSQLEENNVFQGNLNTFNGDVQMRRCHVTSDEREKQEIQPLSPERAVEMVKRIQPYTYQIDQRKAAGVLAGDVPPEFTLGGNSVDYNSLFVHLWAAVQNLQARVEALEAS